MTEQSSNSGDEYYAEITWKFSPADYFEGDDYLETSAYSLVIGNGVVVAKVEQAVYELEPKIHQRIHSELKDYFCGTQLLTHEEYKLSQPSLTLIHADGRRTHFATAEVGIKFSVKGDFVIRDKDGTIVSDSRQERVNKKRRFSRDILIYRSQDEVLDALLRSYEAAVNDPANELIHLYEIRDTLAKVFGGKENATSRLKVTTIQWDRLGELANSLPVRQGRHRGSKYNELRDAEYSELDEAREIARTFIRAYIDQLGDV